MGKPTLYIFSGLPGSGKSTLSKRLAQTLGAAHIRIDTLEQGLKDCGFKEVCGEGNDLAYRVTSDILSSGCSVVADSVNPIDVTRKAWMDVGISSGSEFKNIQVICSDSKEHRLRIEHRDNEVKNLRPLSWEEVISREYDSWDLPRIEIDTANKSVEESMKELLSAISS